MGWAWGRPHTRLPLPQCDLVLTTALKVALFPLYRLETEDPRACEMPGLGWSPGHVWHRPLGPRVGLCQGPSWPELPLGLRQRPPSPHPGPGPSHTWGSGGSVGSRNQLACHSMLQSGALPKVS